MSADPTLGTLIGLAASIGLVHTLIGADHYVPFVVLGRAQRWSLRKVLAVTSLCGVGHVLASIALGAIGIGLGVALGKLEWLEQLRGSVAGWTLIGFGLAYAVWATVRVLRDREHSHPHVHADGTVHAHRHDHHGDHVHPHEASATSGPSVRTVTVWSLFVLFVLGPCEPLIPLLMAPAAELDFVAVALVAATFAGVTVATMTGAAFVGYHGLRLPVFARVERWAHVFAGLAIASSGAAIQLFGL